MTVLVFLTALAAADATTDVDAFFEEFARKRDGIATLEAQFVQEDVVPDETLRTAGTLVYVKPKRVVIRYQDPEPTYIVDGLRLYEYAPDLKQLQIYDLEDNPQTEVLFLGFDDDTERLRQAYDVELFEPTDEPAGARGVILRAKAADDEETYVEKVTLLLRGQDYLPYRIHVEHDDESHVTIRLHAFAVNGPLRPSQTQILLPEGVAIIEHEEKVETVGEGGKAVPAAMTGTGPAAETAGERKAPAP